MECIEFLKAILPFQQIQMNTLKIYARQPSTWLGLAKLGAALGLYSTGVGGAIGTAVIGVFGLVDVIRNEKGQQPLSK
jgi:hypothetical protein